MNVHTVETAQEEERGTTLLELVVGLLVGVALTLAAFTTLRSVVALGSRLRASAEDRLQLDRLTLVLDGLFTEGRRFPALPGIRFEMAGGMGELERLVRAHSSFPPAAGSAIVAVRSIGGGSLLRRAPAKDGRAAEWCHETVGDEVGLPVVRRKAGYVIATLDGFIDASLEGAITAIPRGRCEGIEGAAAGVHPLRPQFAELGSAPPPASWIAIFEIEASLLVFLDDTGTLRKLSLTTGSEQPLSSGWEIFTASAEQRGTLVFAFQRSNGGSRRELSLPDGTLVKASALDTVL